MRLAQFGMVLGLVFLAVGCQNKMHDENQALWRQNRELQAKLQEASAQPKAVPTDTAQLAALQQQIAERDAKINELQNQLRQPAPGAAPDPKLAGIETSYDKASGKMTVNVPGDVLFAPGDASIREEAKSTLDKVANSLKKDYAGKQIRINGHTDADPIKFSKWKSNQDLSEARAAAVRTYLVKKGVSPTIISTHGYGADKPKAKEKSVNRRVEIVVATR
ncbi:MAG TPA: OmpA family protein [Tepidisphaeraceae bacterium]|jgi:flagellar motor protein MotB